MDSSNLMELCRLCLDKDRVSIPIFEGEGVERKIFLKIGSCLPVKVSEDDPLPKKICDDCTYKVELVYSFWNTTANAEKQLLEWLGFRESPPEPTVEMPKTEMVLLKEESLEHEVNPEIGELREDSPGTAEETSGNREESDEESDGNEDPGGGHFSAEEGVSSMNVTVGTAPNCMTEAGPSGIQQQKTTTQPVQHTVQDQQPIPQQSSQPVPQTQPLLPLGNALPDDGDPAGTPGLVLRFKPSSTLWPASGVRAPVPRPQVSVAPLNDWCTVSSPLSPFLLRMRFVQALSSEAPAAAESADPEVSGAGGTDGDSPTTAATESRSGGMVCELCGRQLGSMASMASHLRSHNRRYDCPECGLVFEDARRRNQHRRSTHQRKEFTCPHCDKAFPVKSRLETHLLVHADNAPQYRCDVCDFTTVYPITYKRHVRRHARDFSIFCDHCGRGFFSPSTLAIHVKTVHDKVKPFRCDRCDKCFCVVTALRYHMEEVHDKPPEGCACEQCGKRCSSLPALRRHQRKQHHSRDGKRCICEHCGKELANKTSLLDHLRTHTGEKPFACRYCGDRFGKKQVMIVHERVQHEGERRHKCEECGKAFTQRTPYVIHMRLHTGERPYPCSLCTAAFISRSALNAHLKNHK